MNLILIILICFVNRLVESRIILQSSLSSTISPPPPFLPVTLDPNSPQTPISQQSPSTNVSTTPSFQQMNVTSTLPPPPQNVEMPRSDIIKFKPPTQNHYNGYGVLQKYQKPKGNNNDFLNFLFFIFSPF